jgi:hypothetical protein
VTARGCENVEGGVHFCPLRTANFTSISQMTRPPANSGILNASSGWPDARLLQFDCQLSQVRGGGKARGAQKNALELPPTERIGSRRIA